MGVKGLSYSESFEWVWEKDTSYKEGATIQEMRQDGATVWTIGNVPAGIRTQIQDGLIAANQDGTIGQRQNAGFLRAVEYGLKGVENYSDENGKAIPFTTRTQGRGNDIVLVPDEDFLSTMPTGLIKDMGRRIMFENSVSATERKN